MEKDHGMDISKFDTGFLMQSLEKRRVDAGTADLAEYFNYLVRNHQEANALYSSLHNNFSMFFREPITFAYLEQIVLPIIASSKSNGSEMRIWSTGCSGGQEPYSLAMQLSDINEASENKIKFRIFATDICPEALEQARKGVYGESAVQNVKKKHLDKYFNKHGKTYEIIPELKRNIDFTVYDLLDMSTANPPESIFGDFDVVMCCNVLIYYRNDMRQFIINKLQSALSIAGYFVTSEAEKLLVQNAFHMKAAVLQIPIFKNDIWR